MITSKLHEINTSAQVEVVRGEVGSWQGVTVYEHRFGGIEFRIGRTIGEVICRSLRFEQISPESARQQMLGFLPPGMVDAVLDGWWVDDGTRALNYVEWINEDAHIQALAKSGRGTTGPGPKWLRVKTSPWVVANGFKRYQFRQSLVRSRQSKAA